MKKIYSNEEIMSKTIEKIIVTITNDTITEANKIIGGNIELQNKIIERWL